MNIKLDFYEIYMAATVGVARRLASLKRGQTNKVQNIDFGWHSDIEGACAEIAVAKYLNVFWGGSINTFKMPDVGKLQVRHTQHKNGCLIIRNNDSRHDFYILVTGTHPIYTLQGYILGGDGMKIEYLKNPNNTTKQEAFFIPQEALNSVDGLISASASAH
jgi:hypothetical protein